MESAEPEDGVRPEDVVWGEERHRKVTWTDPMPPLRSLRAMPGLDFLQGMVDGVVGTLTKGGRRVSFASGEIRDAAGAVIATGTSSLLMFEPGV